MPYSPPLISFIVPLHNHLPETQAMLSSLLGSLPPGLAYELILVDDASSDGTPEWLEQLALPQLRWLRNTENQGYSVTNNRGVAEARGKILGLLNNDLLFAPGWLEPMLEVLQHPAGKVGLVGNVQYRVADGALDHAGVRLNLRGQFEHIRALPTDRPAAALPWVTGACVLVWRELFLAVGGFDPRYRNGCEDIDLCFKLRQTGKQVHIAYHSQVRHHVSLSRSTTSEQNERNSRLLFSLWRQEIKQRLATAWATELAHSASKPEELDGELLPGLVQTPHTAGRLLANHRLALQDQYWERLFTQVETPPMAAVTAKLFPLTDRSTHPHQKRLAVEIKASSMLEAIYLCGKLLPIPLSGEFKLSLNCNEMHLKQFSPAPGRSFNLPFKRPLLLPLKTNQLLITVDWYGEEKLSDVLPALHLSHLIIDGEIVDLKI